MQLFENVRLPEKSTASMNVGSWPVSDRQHATHTRHSDRSEAAVQSTESWRSTGWCYMSSSAPDRKTAGAVERTIAQSTLLHGWGDPMIRALLAFALATLVACLGPLGFPGSADAQPRRIGVLLVGFSPESKEAQAFRQGMLDAGYVEGRDVVIEWRYASGDYARVPELSADRVPPAPHVTGMPLRGVGCNVVENNFCQRTQHFIDSRLTKSVNRQLTGAICRLAR
jgi:hypothetical protein